MHSHVEVFVVLQNSRNACARSIFFRDNILTNKMLYLCTLRPVTYSAGNEGQNNCDVFSKTHVFLRSSVPPLDGHT